MKTKNRKPFLNMDERNKKIALKVIAVMYFLTIITIQGIVLYRQFALGQKSSEFEDIAIIMSINSTGNLPTGYQPNIEQHSRAHSLSGYLLHNYLISVFYIR